MKTLKHYIDKEQHIAATSDWASTSRIEEVWMNAHALGNNLIAQL
jgi:hypothetical protein